MQHGCRPLRGHQARGYQARIALARRSAASRRQTAELTRTIALAGTVTGADVAKAMGQASSTEAAAGIEAGDAVTGYAPGAATPIPRTPLNVRGNAARENAASSIGDGGLVASLILMPPQVLQMTSDTQKGEAVGQLLETPDLASALESEQFKKFLDQVPIAIAVSDLGSKERVVYANPEFEKLSGLKAARLARERWAALSGTGLHQQKGRALFEAIVEETDFVGTFRLERKEAPAIVDVYSNLIQDDDGKVCFRLVALVDVSAHGETEDARSIDEHIREKDTLLRELQHRVKNNLQMITALIRLETRNAAEPDQKRFERLAGRVDALAILYQTLSGDDHDDHNDEVDLGVYLSQIASAVMNSHAVEGIRLDMKVDTYPVSINVAMPAGLVVNELLTNALKHAFQGRDGGTITLHSIVDGDGCSVVIADDGIGLPEGETWPKRGKLGALIAHSLTENAKAEFDVKSSPSKGTRVTILFKRSVAAAA